MSNISGGGPGPPPGWYTDAQGTMRWWDGSGWAERTQGYGPSVGSTAAPPPPNAGSAKPWYMKKRWWAVAALVIIFALAAGTGEDDNTPAAATDSSSEAAASESSEREAVAVNALEIVQEFEANELAADSKYKGETVKITGVVNAIDTDFFDEDKYILRLGGGGEYEFLTVNCNDMSTDELSTLSTGDNVTVIGEFDDGGDLGVEVKDCALA